MFRSRKTKRSQSFRRRLMLEPLESRIVLSSITWTNRGADGFDAAFGADAAEARAIVDAAIDSWEAVIRDFNYANVGDAGYAPLANTYDLGLSARNLNVDAASAGRRASTSISGIDQDGKPYQAAITLDNDAAGHGWYFDPTPADHAEFTNLVTRFSANMPGSDFDLYRTTLHEIGHAMGIAGSDASSRLAIRSFLSSAGTDRHDAAAVLYLLEAGTTRATLTTHTGMHVYVGPADPSHPDAPVNPNDLMNAGRAVGVAPVTRRLISDLDASILRDVYGYTVTLPSTLDTFLANFNTTTGVLTINGEPDTDGVGPDTFDDIITLSRSVSGLSLRVDVNGALDLFPVARLTSIVVNAGIGDDTINIRYTPPAVTTTVNGDFGSDTINVGSTANSLDDILGRLTVNGGSGTFGSPYDVLNINDQGDTTANTYSVTNSAVTRSGGIKWSGYIAYADIENLVLNCGRAADTVKVRSTAAATPVTIHGGNGNDTFNLGSTGNSLDALLGAVTINGGRGSNDAININDQGDATANTYSVANNRIARSGVGAVTYNFTVECLVLNCGRAADTVKVRSTSPRTGVTINGGNGNDIFAVGSVSNSLDDIFGPLTINGGGDYDVLNINDQGDATANTYGVTSNTITRKGGVSINYATVEKLVLNCGRAADTVKVRSTAVTTPVTINGGLGVDTFDVAAGIRNVTTVQ